VSDLDLSDIEVHLTTWNGTRLSDSAPGTHQEHAQVRLVTLDRLAVGS
jgi:hypothetical protein